MIQQLTVLVGGLVGRAKRRSPYPFRSLDLSLEVSDGVVVESHLANTLTFELKLEDALRG